jgi:hypothetical protein
MKSLAWFASGVLKKLDPRQELPCRWHRGDRHRAHRDLGQTARSCSRPPRAFDSRSSDSGGAVTEVVKADRAEGAIPFPWFLPDGRRFLYSARLEDGTNRSVGAMGQPSLYWDRLTRMLNTWRRALVLVANGALRPNFDREAGELIGALFGGRFSQFLFHGRRGLRHLDGRNPGLSA